MCKMLFLGTQNELQEIPPDTSAPDLYLEKITGELLPIRDSFKNRNIYFVGTSRGCSCNFGIQSNKRDKTSIQQTPPIQNILNKFRKLGGTFIDWEKRQQAKVDNILEAQANYLTQTLKLVDIILNETKKSTTVEMFCVWSGDYKAIPEFTGVIDTKKINLKENFEITEKEFLTFV